MASRVATNHLNKKRRFERAFNNDIRKVYVKETKYIQERTKKGLGAEEFKHSEELAKALLKQFKRIRLNVLRKTEWATRAYTIYENVMYEKLYNDIVGSYNKLALSMEKKNKKNNFSTEYNEEDYKLVYKFVEENEDTWDLLMYAMIPSRTLIIANYGNQEMYEATNLINGFDKDIEKTSPEIVGSAIAMGTYGVITSNKTKTWRSVLSQKTRGWHAQADGQTVKLTEPFIVNGQSLMYPGDSRNSTPDNFMNCYCSVQYN